jgi:hypothetical protein
MLTTRSTATPRLGGGGRWGRRTAALVVVAGLVAAGCSDGSSGSGDGVGPGDGPSGSTADPSGGSPSTTATPSEPTAVASGIEVAWATTLTGATLEDEIDGIAADDEGALWVTGKFERTTELGGEDLTSAGAADIPLARFDRDGAPQWVRSFGGPGEDNLFDIDAVDDTAVGTGWFEGTIAFDDIELTSAGSTDCVVAAFDGDGSVRWAKAYGGPGPDGCNEVVVSDDGSITTSMDTAGGWDSPAGRVGTTSAREVVLLRLDADGEDRWAGLVSGPAAQRGKSLAVADDGTVALGGDATAPGRSRRPGWPTPTTPSSAGCPAAPSAPTSSPGCRRVSGEPRSPDRSRPRPMPAATWPTPGTGSSWAARPPRRRRGSGPTPWRSGRRS